MNVRLRNTLNSKAWEVSTWAGAEHAHLEDALEATPAQRLRWLEDALRLANESGALTRLRQEREMERGRTTIGRIER